MKLIYSMFFVAFISFTSFSQDNKDIAKIYFKKAKESYLHKDSKKTERYLAKAIEYYGSIKTEEVAIFGANFFFEENNFLKAKEYLTVFFSLNKNKKSQNYTNMLILYTDTIDAIDNPDEYKKDTKKVSLKTPINTFKKEVNTDNNIEIKESDSSNEENYEIVEEEIEPENVSFMIIEEVPVFPGCLGNKNELKNCFSKMVQVHFATFFDGDLPNTLGLSPGRKRVFIGFKITRDGYVENIACRAPHPKLREEVIRVMKLLPKMTPGKQRGKTVAVKYSIPFTLIVEGDNDTKDKKN